MLRGTVVRKIPEKGFGFIRHEETGLEYFFHMSACGQQLFDELQQGDLVEFAATRTDKGPRAVEVALIDA